MDAIFGNAPAPPSAARQPPRQPPAIFQAMRRRAGRHAGPHDAPQEPVDITGNHDAPISDLLAQARNKQRPARSNDYLHVSALIYQCTRATALEEHLGQPPQGQQLRLADRLTYRQGEAIAEIIVSAVQETAPAALWGTWECRCQRTRTATPCTYAEATAHPACTHCERPLDTYVEVPMFNEEYKIVGNPDLLLFLETYNCFHITELKSITPNEFPELARAKPEHVIQAIFYWWLMKELGYRLTTHVSIVYINKGHTFRGAQYKEFTVDVASQVDRLTMFLEEAAALKAFRAGNRLLPSRERCQTADDNLAKKCHVCQACFTTSQTISRRQRVDLSALADSPEPSPDPAPPIASDPEPAVRRPATRPPPGPAVRAPRIAPGSRVPAPTAAGDRPVAGPQRLRLPSRRR